MKKEIDSPSGKKLSKAQKVAIGGVFSAVSLLILLVGGTLPLSTFVAPLVAGALLMPVMIEVGFKFALLAYIAVSLLVLLISHDKEMAFFFIFLLGYYPIIFPYLQKIKSTILRYLAKFVIFNVSLCIIYGLLYLLLGPAIFEQGILSSSWVIIPLWIFGNAIFLMYDVLITRLRFVYVVYFRKRIFR